MADPFASFGFEQKTPPPAAAPPPPPNPQQMAMPPPQPQQLAMPQYGFNQGHQPQPPPQHSPYASVGQMHFPPQTQQTQPGSGDSNSGFVVVASPPPPAPAPSQMRAPSPQVTQPPQQQFVQSNLDFFPPSGGNPVAHGSALSPMASSLKLEVTPTPAPAPDPFQPMPHPSPFDQPPPPNIAATQKELENCFGNFTMDEQKSPTPPAAPVPQAPLPPKPDAVNTYPPDPVPQAPPGPPVAPPSYPMPTAFPSGLSQGGGSLRPPTPPNTTMVQQPNQDPMMRQYQQPQQQQYQQPQQQQQFLQQQQAAQFHQQQQNLSPYGAPPPQYAQAQFSPHAPPQQYAQQLSPHAPPPQQQQQQQQYAQQPSPAPPAPVVDDIFQGMDDVFGFSNPEAEKNAEGVFVPTLSRSFSESESGSDEKQPKAPPLPSGREFDAKVFAPILGVMFYKASELTSTSFRTVDPNVVSQLAARPIVAFVASQGGAAQAGVRVGDVCTEVNGVRVSTARAAANEVRKGSRPLSLKFLRMEIPITFDEGFHLVKYDTPDLRPPSKSSGFKPKYCVVGGIIAPPHMLMMYRSKDEMDIAVLEITSQRKLSVKVKEFSLRGARIANDLNGPQIAQLKGSHTPVYFICIVPARGNPIKISSPNLEDLKSVHSAVRRSIARSSSNTSSLQQGYQTATENPQPPLAYVAGDQATGRIRTTQQGSPHSRGRY